MKKIKYLVSGIIMMLAATACSNFDELNTDPNKTTKVTPELLATQIMRDSYRFWNPNPSDFATDNLWNKHTALVETNPNPYQYYFSYWPYGGFGSFKRLTDLKRMVEYSKGTKYENSFNGLALYMKATYGFKMTLDMGDIPYSEAGKAEEGITKPKYDKQADVFIAILNDLKAAEEYFAKGENFDGDLMLRGDVVKWRRLCNAMQLKVLQTMSKKITFEQKARFAEIVAAGNLMAGNDNIYQLTYYDNPNATHPYWNGDVKRQKNTISKLAADALKSMKDRRLFLFAEPAEALLKAGKSESDFDAYEGAPTELAPNVLKENGEAGKYSLINKRYTLLRAGDPMLIFTYAEQCFIIAEAIEEGWVDGSAQDYYENGVKSMLTYYKDLPSASTGHHGMPITQEYIDGYFTGEAAYATSGSKTDRLKQIWIQRWLIDFFQGNGGNYVQVLRTGYPVYPLDPSTSMNLDGSKHLYPKRWMYPTGEQTTNPENYKKAVDEQFKGYDTINEALWYLQ